MRIPSKESRTAKSIKNSTTALIFFCVDFVLKFFSRSIFLKILGDEVLGLNSTMMNLLQFLNLAELGIGAAVGFTLYKPIAHNNTEAINEIIQLNGHLYRRIALLVGLGSIVLMFFFPLIFKKIDLPLWYAYATFLIFLLGLLLNYSMNYKQILLSASQMDYKIQYSYKSCHIVKVIVQIVAVTILSHPYLWWLLIEGVFSIISTFTLNLVIKQTFPYLGKGKVSYRELKHKYISIITKIKQIFFHKICGFILTQTSPLIIYAYLSLSVVTLYTNYLIITSGITQLLNAAFNSVTNAIGNLVAENNINKILKVFYETFSLRFYIASLCCFSLLVFSKSFIIIWLGKEYVLPDSTLYIIVSILYISLTRTTIDAFINAYGLYQDIASPIIESIINLGMSILLGFFWGLNGILSGTLISLIIVVFIWKPYYLFTRALNASILEYIYIYIKHVVILVISYIIFYTIWTKLGLSNSINNLWLFFGIAIGCISFFSVIFLSMMIICKMPLLETLKRFRN